MRNLTVTIHFCDISQSFVSATKYENTSSTFYHLSISRIPSSAQKMVAMRFPPEDCVLAFFGGKRTL
jgi:hypothetical protein